MKNEKDCDFVCSFGLSLWSHTTLFNEHSLTTSVRLSTALRNLLCLIHFCNAVTVSTCHSREYNVSRWQQKTSWLAKQQECRKWLLKKWFTVTAAPTKTLIVMTKTRDIFRKNDGRKNSRCVTLADNIKDIRFMTKLPRTVMMICRQGSQSFVAEQHSITLSCICVTSTASLGSGSAAENGKSMERKVFLL